MKDNEEAEEVYDEFEEIHYPYDSPPYGLWTFEMAACINRNSSDLPRIDCSLPMVSSRVILEVHNPCETGIPDHDKYPQCDLCNIEPVDYEANPECDLGNFGNS